MTFSFKSRTREIVVNQRMESDEKTNQIRGFAIKHRLLRLSRRYMSLSVVKPVVVPVRYVLAFFFYRLGQDLTRLGERC